MSTLIPRPQRHARIGTIVWGAVILAVAGLLLAGQFFALSIDPVVVALGLLIGVGLSLVLGGVLSLRTRHADDDHPDGPLDDSSPTAY